MDIPILSNDPTVKRYRYSALHLPVRFGQGNYKQFMTDPNPYVCRSLEEWSAFFGFEVQLAAANIKPACIGWVEFRGNE